MPSWGKLILVGLFCPPVGQEFTKDFAIVLVTGDVKHLQNRISHERPHLAIWVKFMRPEDVRKSSIVSMMKDWKDLLKFVMLERAAAIISLSWIRGLVFIQVTCYVTTTKLLKIKRLSKFFKHYSRDFLHFFRLFSRSFSGRF